MHSRILSHVFSSHGSSIPIWSKISNPWNRCCSSGHLKVVNSLANINLRLMMPQSVSRKHSPRCQNDSKQKQWGKVKCKYINAGDKPLCKFLFESQWYVRVTKTIQSSLLLQDCGSHIDLIFESNPVHQWTTNPNFCHESSRKRVILWFSHKPTICVSVSVFQFENSITSFCSPQIVFIVLAVHRNFKIGGARRPLYEAPWRFQFWQFWDTIF